MSWPYVIVLTVATFGAILWLFPRSRAAWQAIAAALLLGLAGYTMQAHPSLAGAPRARDEVVSADPGAEIAARRDLSGDDGQRDKHLVIADALMRHGQFADAATILRGAVDKDPRNAEAWLAMANALVGHAEGNLSPAALYAYRRASQADPASPGPPYFLGLMLARNGRLEEGRTLWAALLAQAPADAPWRAGLAERLGQLDAFIAQSRQTAGR